MIKNPFQANDFVDVTDVARAFSLAIEKDVPSGIYNLGSGRSRRIIDVCKLVEKKVRGKVELSQKIKMNEQPALNNFWADLSKTEKFLSWKPRSSFEKGIENYIQQEMKTTQ